MTADAGIAAWRAMREWLISTRADAQGYLDATPPSAPTVCIGFAAQVEVLTCALDFMDERERAS
jgi:hypothetical protein